MSPVTKPSRKALFYLILVLIVVSSVELFSFAYLGFSTGQWATANFFFRHHFAQQQKKGCWWADSITPHPYLSYAYHRGEPCSQKTINNNGLKGLEIPPANDPEYYDILLLGGSVAELFSAHWGESPNLLEVRLNKSYVSPNGKPFRLLNGALAAGKEPMQLVSLILFGDRVDAVMSLEGYNELAAYLTERPLTEPTHEWTALMASRSRLDLLHHKSFFLVRIAADIAADNFFLSRSYTAFLFTRLAYAIVERDLKNQRSAASVESPVPDFPPTWNSMRRRQEVLSQYKRMLRLQRAMAREGNLPYFAFIQPAPALYKTLTSQERAVVGDISYGAAYQEFTREILSLRKEGFPIASLLKILLPVEKSIYVDNIHFEGDGNNGLGNELMAEAVADILATEWRLERRK